jgi:hypothetical protein
MTNRVKRSVEQRRFYLQIMYRGPWEILTSWLLGNGRTWQRDVADGSLRERLSRWTEHRDHEWREQYVQWGTKPAQRWKRGTK